MAINYFRNPRLGFWVNPRKNLILTGFLASTFEDETAENSHFCGGKNYALRPFTTLALNMPRPRRKSAGKSDPAGRPG
jgi:hypothetical protein